MVNKKKQKGSAWEAQLVDILNREIDKSTWRRIPSSGAMGTSLSEPLLMSDIKGEVKHFPKKFRVECKAGYNHSNGKETKQFTIYKEWLDKIEEEAKKNYSFPLLACKFDNARSGVKQFIVLDINNFIFLVNKVTELQEMLEDEHTI